MGLAVIIAGLFTPIHFESVSRTLVEQAGEGTLQVEDLAKSYQNRASWGVVDILTGESKSSSNRIESILGGEDVFMKVFLDAHPQLVEEFSSERPVVSKIFLDSQFIASLEQFLEKSNQSTVQNILSLRDLTQWKVFPPAYSVGGKPLRSTLALLAMLEQSHQFSDQFSLELKSLITRGLSGDQTAITAIEEGLLTLVALQRRLPYVPLASITIFCESWEDFAAFNDHYLQTKEIELSTWYTAILLGESWQDMNRYRGLAEAEQVNDFLQLATLEGRGAIEWIFEHQFEIYSPPIMLGWVEKLYQPLRSSQLFRWFIDQPQLSLFIKIFLIGLGAYIISFFLCSTKRQSWLLSFSFHSTFALSLGVAILLWAEPNLLEAQHQEESKLSLNFGAITSLESLESHMVNLENLDPVTLFILALFFLVQFVIYVIGLMKVVEIRSQSIPAELKIKLLDNEDLLFDFGLYIGLGGTVTSLIMLALGVVEASLIAAYASTLFGIIFVAILKILHVRPLKRKLLMETR